MNTTILITGANGTLAKHLKKILQQEYQLKFLTRTPKLPNEYYWDYKTKRIDQEALQGVNHIIHLAGASIGEKRWNKHRKKEIIESRVLSAKFLLEVCQKANIKLKSYISASAIGYYDHRHSEQIQTETSVSGTDFLSNVCRQWEQSAKDFYQITDKVGILRLGVIICPKSGIIKKMLPFARYGLNPILGTGKQIISWIDKDDLCAMIQFCLKKSINGIYNAVSPCPISNKDFTYTMAEILKKPVYLPAIPTWFLQIIFGQMATLFLEGKEVSCQKIIDEGFVFKYETFAESLNKILKNQQ